jgi:hypothetical protein
MYLIQDITLQGISSNSSRLKNKFSFRWWRLPAAWRNKLASQPGGWLHASGIQFESYWHYCPLSAFNRNQCFLLSLSPYGAWALDALGVSSNADPFSNERYILNSLPLSLSCAPSRVASSRTSTRSTWSGGGCHLHRRRPPPPPPPPLPTHNASRDLWDGCDGVGVGACVLVFVVW